MGNNSPFLYKDTFILFCEEHDTVQWDTFVCVRMASRRVHCCSPASPAALWLGAQRLSHSYHSPAHAVVYT